MSFTWVDLASFTIPNSSEVRSLAYDSTRQRTIALVPEVGPVGPWIHYEFDGAAWTSIPYSVSTAIPSNFGPDCMGFHEPSGTMILSGGTGTGGYETWTYDPSTTTWTKESPAHSPPTGVFFHFQGCAPWPDGSYVLFWGGPSGSPDETWTWDGSDWTQLSPATSPAASGATPVGYDPVRDVIVLFDTNQHTWEWNGTTWTQVVTTHAPAVDGGGAATATSLAYSTDYSALLLFGNVVAAHDAETWTYNGSDWTLQSLVASPPGRYSPVGQLAVTGTGDTVLVVGGINPTTGGAYDDTWILTTSGVTADSVFVNLRFEAQGWAGGSD